MKAFMLIAGGGPIVILTSYGSVTDPALLNKLKAKGIDKFMAYEMDLETAKERYGGHFQLVMNDLNETDDLRVLDYSGQRVFQLFRFDELGTPIIHEGD